MNNVEVANFFKQRVDPRTWRYVYGGSKPGACDCSGLFKWGLPAMGLGMGGIWQTDAYGQMQAALRAGGKRVDRAYAKSTPGVLCIRDGVKLGKPGRGPNDHIAMSMGGSVTVEARGRRSTPQVGFFGDLGGRSFTDFVTIPTVTYGATLADLVKVEKALARIAWANGKVTQIGDTGFAVKWIQRTTAIWLALLGHGVLFSAKDGDPSYGTFDQATAYAVGVFQQLAGLPATGAVDKVTADRLFINQ